MGLTKEEMSGLPGSHPKGWGNPVIQCWHVEGWGPCHLGTEIS